MMQTTPPPYLTKAEILEIVEPLTQPAAIMRWFRNNGYAVKPRPNGLPLVTRTNFEQVSGGNTTKPVATGEQPDVGAYLERVRQHSKKGAVV